MRSIAIVRADAPVDRCTNKHAVFVYTCRRAFATYAEQSFRANFPGGTWNACCTFTITLMRISRERRLCLRIESQRLPALCLGLNRTLLIPKRRGHAVPGATLGSP